MAAHVKTLGILHIVFSSLGLLAGTRHHGPGFVAGVGLLGFKPWARVLTIILSAIELLNVPFGTALGVYGLWILLSRETEPLFLQQARATWAS